MAEETQTWLISSFLNRGKLLLFCPGFPLSDSHFYSLSCSIAPKVTFELVEQKTLQKRRGHEFSTNTFWTLRNRNSDACCPDDRVGKEGLEYRLKF